MECSAILAKGTVSEAIAFAMSGDLEFAILDVNLGTELYPVADILMPRGIPFAFATGYAASGIQSRYPSSPILHKPFARDHLQALIEQLRPRAGVCQP